MKNKHIASCGQCRFLSRHKKFELPCENLGKIATSKQCNQFEPDVFALVENEQSRERFLEFAALMSEIPTSQVMVYAEVLLRERKTRKAGHYLGELIYIQFRGNSTDQYFSNFLQGYVLKAGKNELLLVDENSSHYWVMDYERGERYFTEREFAPIRERMLQEKRFIDPAIKRLRKKEELINANRGHAMSIGDADDLLEKTGGKQDKPKKKKSRPDMVDMAHRITRGHISKRKNSENHDEENNNGGVIPINHFG